MNDNRKGKANKTHPKDCSTFAATWHPKASDDLVSSSRSVFISRWRDQEIEVQYTDEWMDAKAKLDWLIPDALVRDTNPPEGWQRHAKVARVESPHPALQAHSAGSSMIPNSTPHNFEGQLEDFTYCEDKDRWNITRRLSTSQRSDSAYYSFLDEIEAGYQPDDFEMECCSDISCYQLPPSALPGLNMILNLATTTSNEWDLFRAFSPPDLTDPLQLMDAVSRKRHQMMGGSLCELMSSKSPQLDL